MKHHAAANGMAAGPKGDLCIRKMKVRIAAPFGVSGDAIRIAVLARIPWIKRKQSQFLKQERQAQRRFVSGETHFLFGRSLRLDVQRWV